MTCAELRRLLLIEPSHPALAEHARACPDCARLLEDALRFERRLETALGVDRGDSSGRGPWAGGGGIGSVRPSALEAMGRRWLGRLWRRRGPQAG